MVKEMMFGMGDEFRYMRCGQCGLLQICEMPDDMGKYYPSNEYYSLSAPEAISTIKKLKNYVRKKAETHVLTKKKNLIGVLITVFHPSTPPLFLKLLKDLPHELILDVGCGCGTLLNKLAINDFHDLYGVDLFIDRDITTPSGVKIKKGTIHDMSDQFKLVMLHHSFEHMEDQLPVLQKIRQLLLPGGVCMIRIPVMNTAWESYHENWYQIDAPRHFYLHTEKSLSLLANEAGLSITKVVYDSYASQFISSELYIKGIPLRQQTKNTIRKHFSSKQLRGFRQKANQFNEEQKGDQAIFILKAKTEATTP